MVVISASIEPVKTVSFNNTTTREETPTGDEEYLGQPPGDAQDKKTKPCPRLR